MIQIVNSAIDTVQSVKTHFVDMYVANEEIKKPLKTYINAQASFAKTVAREANSFFTTLGTSLYNFDASKAFTK